MSARPPHLLSGVPRMWAECRGELEAARAAFGAELSDTAGATPDEVKKASKWVQHTVTKFGASASVADGPERDDALRPIAEEVIKAFTAAAGTLLALRQGAGSCFMKELRDAGNGLSDAIDGLGAAVGTPQMAVCAGKALDRATNLERLSAHNRAAIRKRFLESLGQISDASRELQEVLRKDPGGGDPDPDSDADDRSLGGFSDDLEPEERRVVEAMVPVVVALEESLKQALEACLPTAGSLATLAHLEAAAAQSTAVANAIDGLATHAMGGLDAAALQVSFDELRVATPSLGVPVAAEASALQLEQAMAAMQATVAEVS